MVSHKMIIGFWRVRKLSHEQCIEDLLLSREPSCLRLISLVENVRIMETDKARGASRACLLSLLVASLGAFRAHKNIDCFLAQFIEAQTKPCFRFKTLLLRGRSRMGKSQRAVSLFGVHGSLIVNCQGLNSSLPSLRHFIRGQTLCIIFDEISAEQVLANKLIFQAGPWPVTLGQSACGQHAYTLDLYAIPMICCSNDFKTTVQDGLSVEAADWISENILEASPPEGLAWYWPADPDGGVCLPEPG